MRSIRPFLLVVALGAGAATAMPAMAQDFGNQLKARQGQFRVLALNLGVLGAMAKGEMEYDAALAGAAAGNVVTVTQLNQAPFWPAGSDAMSIEGTRAEPAIWDDFDGFASKWSDLGTAAAQLTEAAASGQEALGPAIGAVGGACKACHDDYRTPDS